MFFRYVLATFVGLFAFTFLMFLLLLGVGAIISSEPDVKIAENSVLYLRLDQPIVEQTVDDPIGEILSEAFGESQGKISLIDIKKALADAAGNENIKGIYLEPRYVDAGFAKLKEIRDDLLKFKESGKFIIAYGEYMSEKDYYLASVADEITIAPVGNFEFNGLRREFSFFKGSFKKLEIEPQIFKVGEFKSYVEPFVREDLSDANRLQTSSYLNSIYSVYLNDASASLGIPQDELKNISDSMLIRNTQLAVDYKLVTRAGYFHEVIDDLKARLELEEDEKVKLVSVRKYAKYLKGQDPEVSKNKIAVIIGEGQIVWGKGEDPPIGSEDFAKEIRKARKNERIKAIVLRINSPGGSFLASDVIWKEIIEAKKEKPVIASMSDLAASGGYYLSMSCDTIVAQPTTLTGSIGIFGMIFNLQDFLDHKLGITTDVVKTGELSDIMRMSRPLNDFEKGIIQNMVEEGYETFTSKAAEGRSMSQEDLKKVAEGRVWTGQEALEIGLVDILGNYDDAIEIAAKAAGVEDDYKVGYYPKPKDPFQQIMGKLSGDLEDKFLEAKLGEFYPYFNQVKELEKYKGIQARLPYDIEIQ